MSKVSPYFGPELPSTHPLLGLSLGYLPELGPGAAPSIFARYSGLTPFSKFTQIYIRIYYIETISIESRARLACIGQVPVLWLFTVNVNYTTCGNNAEKPLDQTEARRAKKNSFETASPFPRVWITTPRKEMSLIFMIDCGHEELKIGEKNASTAMLSFS